MEDYYLGVCNISRMESLPWSAAVNWTKPVIQFLGNSTSQVLVQPDELCSSVTGIVFQQPIDFPFYATECIATIGSKLALEVLASNER